MRVKLEKWYLDFTSEKALGFYYIMCLSIGPFRVGFSGINHYDSSGVLKSFKFSRLHHRSFHALQLRNAGFSTSLKSASLHINHGHSQMRGTWLFLAPPQKRINKPFYTSEKGWCDWKLWTPKAEVDIEVKNNGRIERLQGTGYIDYVRFNLSPWKMPFRSLYWGRVHSKDSWGVFISLAYADKSISLYMDPEEAEQDISVQFNKENLSKPVNFLWTLGPRANSNLFDCKIIRNLENEEILGKGRFLKQIPPRLRKKISSSGRDEKYEIRSTFREEEFYGIMEEVSWDAQNNKPSLSKFNEIIWQEKSSKRLSASYSRR